MLRILDGCFGFLRVALKDQKNPPPSGASLLQALLLQQLHEFARLFELEKSLGHVGFF